MTRPLVSVVIPVFNGERFLRQAIDSALAQTYDAVEVIAVDDGSTDGSPAILASYGDRVRAIRQPNSGVSRARNAGIASARGEFIAFLDQDDWWQPAKLERQAESVLSDAEIGLVHTDAAHFDEPSQSYAGRINWVRTELLTGRCYDRLLLGNGIFNSSVLVRKSALNAVGGFNEDIRRNTIQDYDLWLRIAKQYAFAYIAEPLMVYRLHPDQGMWNVRDSLLEELRLLERTAGPDGLASTPEMKVHVAALLQQLTIRHLDAGDRTDARATARRSLGLRWSWRDAGVWAATFLPMPVVASLRRVHGRIQSRPESTRNHVPAWSGVRPAPAEVGSQP